MDSLLLTFIAARDEAEAEHCLTRLINDHGGPIVREILRSNLRLHVDANGGASSNQDAGDLFNDIVVNLVSQLRRIKDDPARESITDFRSYVAGTAYNACNLYLRQKFPRRSRLKNRLRSLLSHHAGLAPWASELFGMLCGLSAWRDKENVAPGRLLEAVRQNPVEWIQAVGLTNIDISRAALTELLQCFFQWAKSPIRLDDLVSVVAEICREKDQPDEPLEAVMNLPIPALSFDTVLEQQRILAIVWQEICQLPLRQRAALLLNFTDARSRELISLLPYTRTATIEQIANVLEMPAADFAKLWNDLPLDDLTIAKFLGATRQQVINLRKCARERLERRMTGVLAKSSAAK